MCQSYQHSSAFAAKSEKQHNPHYKFLTSRYRRDHTIVPRHNCSTKNILDFILSPAFPAKTN